MTIDAAAKAIPPIAEIVRGSAPQTDDRGAGNRRPPVPNYPSAEREPEDLGLMHAPDPVGPFMLVALPEIEAKTAGGIIRPDTVNDRERAASVIGKVIDMGPDCYKDTPPVLPELMPGMTVVLALPRPRFPSGPWCKIGDTVLFSRYAGKRFTIEGVEFRMLADDEITATIPEGAKVGGL